MKNLLLIVALMSWSFALKAQSDSTSGWDALHDQGKQKAEEKRREDRSYGCTLFAGLGRGGNQYTSGMAAGAAIRAHYKFHTLNLHVVNVNRLEYHGEESDTPTLQSSQASLAYGVGIYDKVVSISLCGGVGYTFTTWSTGGGVNYKHGTYNKFGSCIGFQFSVHGKYFGGGFQLYDNISFPQSDYCFLVGLEMGLNH